MSSFRALAETPGRRPKTSLIRRIAGLPHGAVAAAASGLGRLRLAPHLDGEAKEDDLWFLLLAMDPDGVWLPWTAAGERPGTDDAVRR
jgi:hypothetical protein